MNCPSRTDNPDGREGWNQSPNRLSGTTREDLNGIANTRTLRGIEPVTPALVVSGEDEISDAQRPRDASGATIGIVEAVSNTNHLNDHVSKKIIEDQQPQKSRGCSSGIEGFIPKARRFLVKFSKFVGPGFMISVAYIDPGNYATDVAAGQTYKYSLLFVILMSNIFAIFLQSLCIKLGTISGMDLAQMSRAHLPKWLNYFLYLMAEGAIIATDISEVIGTAIALNLLIPSLPLVAGCAISIIDVLLILLFYRPGSSMKGLRGFEMFVMALVLGVVICFCIQLSLLPERNVGEIFRGYLPSSVILEKDGLYQACGILGATVMPHSLYLGSGIVQPRLLEYDIKNNLTTTPSDETPDSSSNSEKSQYHPSLAAINFCLNISIVELTISLFSFALFVNSAILIVAGSSNFDQEDPSLFAIYNMLAQNLGSAAGKLFALALLLSGISAGIVCTIAGQMVSEGALNWTIAPWLRRMITRAISITPSIIIAAAVGKDGLTDALNATQVALSVVLPFVSAPLIYFTCRNKFMSVRTVTMDTIMDHERISAVRGGATRTNAETSDGSELGASEERTKMRNHWVVATFAVITWLIIVGMNVANLVLLGVK